MRGHLSDVFLLVNGIWTWSWAKDIHGMLYMPAYACPCYHTCLYRERKYTWHGRSFRSNSSQHSQKIWSYLKLQQFNAIVASDLKYRQHSLEAEGVAASADVLCLCRTEQQTVNTLTCQTFKPWTINGMCLLTVDSLSNFDACGFLKIHPRVVEINVIWFLRLQVQILPLISMLTLAH